MELLGPRLKQIRKASKRTQEQVCAESGLTQAMISAFENGKGDPALSTLRKLAAAYQVSLAAIFSDEPPPKPTVREPTQTEIAMFVLGNLRVTDTQRAVIRAALESDEKASAMLRAVSKEKQGSA